MEPIAAIAGIRDVARADERDLFHALRGDEAVLACLDEGRWRALAEASLRTFSAPLLYARLRQRRGLGRVPDPVVARLARMRAWSASRWSVSVAQVEELGAALGAEQLPCLVLKGAHLGLRYPVPGSRATGDIDLLVHSDHVSAAHRVLQGLGYLSEGGERLGGEHRHLAPLHRRGSLPVELHRTLARRAEPTPWADAVWARAEPWGGGGPALGMETHDALLYACKHLGAHHAFNTPNALAALADVALLVEEPLDPDVIAARADAWGIRAAVALCLRLAALLLGARTDTVARAVDVPGTDEMAPRAVWMMMHVGGSGATRHLQLATAPTLVPPHARSGIRDGPLLRSAWAYGRQAALPPLGDLRLDRPGLSGPAAYLGYPLHWARLGWRHAGLLRLADPRVRAEIRADKAARQQSLRRFLRGSA